MIKTRLYKSSDLDKPSVIEDIRQTLLQGKNIVFPTETVYGIGANALDLKGIKNIYKVKGRPSDNPLIMHISKEEDMYVYTKDHQSYVKPLARAFWPGPLTMVLKKKDLVPQMITGGLDTVGIRLPANEAARTIIDIAGVPICAPSANISGRPSSTRLEHVIDDFMGKVDIIIDGGKSQVGLESTVLDVSKEVPVILRPGMVTKSMIETIVPKVIFSQSLQAKDIPKAPGMKYKHYAPKGSLYILRGQEQAMVDYINDRTIKHHQMKEKVGAILTKALAGKVKTDHIFTIGDADNEQMIAANLFASLRSMDALNVDVIYTMAYEFGPYQEAIMNRLLKAANYQVINLK